MHLTDEQLHRQIDQQFDATNHLNACAECRARLDAMQARTRAVRAHLATLDPRANEQPRATSIAYAAFTQKQLERKEGFSMRNIFSRRLRPLWIGLSAIILFALALSFPPVQVWAGDLLALFRVQKIVVVPMDTTRLSELRSNSLIAEQVSQLFSDSSKVTKEPGVPKPVASAMLASQSAGFAVRLPSNRADAPQISVQGDAAFQFTINRARAQSLIDEAGFKQYRLPASLDGALIKVNVPKSVAALYGECPKPDRDKNAPTTQKTTCIVYAQLPSPVVDAPRDLDVAQLAIIGLQFTGMTEAQAREYSKTVDWTSTLVIPIPRNGTAHKQIAVDGVTGYLIQETTSYIPQYVIVWIKNGIIYSIGGYGTDASAAIAMANSLR
ncbi:MAG: hypothetical protein HZC40_08650 [Chloroflexi bacterium]|nr:hypothetical protein [Chloroflexota bacterium]